MMRKIVNVFAALLVTACFSGYAAAAPAVKMAKTKSAKAVKEEPKEAVETKTAEAKKGAFQAFSVYTDQGAKTNHYAPSGWMGDYGDLKINPGWADNPHSGKTSLKVTYSAKMSQNAGWTGIFWQDPSNNWGDKKGGFNLTGASKLTFWARGDKGGEKITEFKFGGITGEYPDSDSQAIGPVELSTQWQKFSVDLADKDLSSIIGGFCFSASKDDNPSGFTIYLDDIQYE